MFDDKEWEEKYDPYLAEMEIERQRIFRLIQIASSRSLLPGGRVRLELEMDQGMFQRMITAYTHAETTGYPTHGLDQWVSECLHSWIKVEEDEIEVGR